MKWYKRDPDAALAGMAELSFEECGAYNRLLDLLYSRDGNVPDDDAFCAKVFHCRPQVWRRLKAALIAKGKVHETGGKLTANRVENELQTAHKRIELMRGLRQKQLENQRNSLARAPGQPQPQPGTEVRTSVEKRSRKKPATSFPENWFPKAFDLIADRKLFESMRDDCLAHDRRYVDWEAAARKWKEREPQFSRSRSWGNNGTPRPGSREDRQEKTANAIAELNEYIARKADERRRGGETRNEDDWLLSVVKPA